jgi:hypothetical protein
MNRQKSPLFYTSIIFVAFFFLSSCYLDEIFFDEPTGDVPISRGGDYFPLDSSHHWKYVTTHRYNCHCNDSGAVLIDTLMLTVVEDEKGDFFWMMHQDGWAYKYIRKTGDLLFEYPPYGRPFIFLDQGNTTV